MIYVYALGCLSPLIAVLLQQRLMSALPLMISLFWAITAGVVGVGTFTGMAADAALAQEQFSYLLQISIMMFVAWMLYTWINVIEAHLKAIIPITIITICHCIVAMQAGMLMFPGGFSGASAAQNLSTSPTSLTVVLAVASVLTVLTFMAYLAACLIVHLVRMLTRKA